MLRNRTLPLWPGASGEPPNRWRFVWPLVPPLVLGLLPFIVFAPITIVHRVFSAYDVQGYFFPYHVLPAKMLEQGYLPLWNPYVFSGMPLLGDGQTAMFFPLNWLFFVLPGTAALNYVVLLQFSIAGLSMYALARALGLCRMPAFLTAVSYMFCGFMTARVVHLSIMGGVALIPLILFCVDGLLTRGLAVRGLAVRWFALAGLAVALQALAGHPQIPVYTAIAVFLYGIVRGVEQSFAGTSSGPLAHATGRPSARVSWRPLARALLLVGGVYALGIAAAAVQLVPWAELARFSVRGAGADYTWVFGTSTTGAEWLLFLFPYLLGAHDASPFALGSSGSWGIWQSSRVWEHSGYVGILPLALVLVGLWHFVELTRSSRAVGTEAGDAEAASSGEAGAESWRERSADSSRRRWYTLAYLVLLLATGITLGAGWHTPFSSIIYRVPILGSLRAVERGLVLGSFSLTLLAGFGLQRIVERRQRVRGLVVPALLILIVPAFFVWPAQMHPWRLYALTGIDPRELARLSPAWPGTWAPLLLALATALLLVWWSWRGVGPRTLGVAATLVVFDLGLYAIGFTATTTRSFYEYEPHITRMLREDGELCRKATFLVDVNDVVGRVGQDVMALSWGMVYGVEDINGFNSLQTRRYTDYVFGPHTSDVSYGYLRDPSLLRSDNPILSSLNVCHLVVPARVGIQPGPHLLQVFEDSRVRVFENTQAYPRAYFVEQVRREPDPKLVLQQVTATGFDGRRTALVEGTEGPLVPPSTMPAQASASRWSPTDLRVTTQTTEPRFLVVSEMYFPGWHAMVDGVETPIFRTNYLFRGVVVPAGQHVVRFVYRPFSALAGAIVSLLALTGIGSLFSRGLGRLIRPRTFAVSVPSFTTSMTQRSSTQPARKRN